MSLEVDRVSTGYGRLQVVREASIRVDAGQIVAIVGPNGAGKSSFMKAIARSLPISSGAIKFNGTDLSKVRQSQIAGLGIGYVPQQGNVFPELTVQENMSVSCRGSATDARREIDSAFSRFPRLQERRRQAASTLSGGERQMLAIACAMIGGPSLLMLDEPTTGLAPLIVRERISDIQKLRDNGTSVLWIIEEQPRICLPVADRVHFMSDGNLGEATAPDDILAEGVLEGLFFGATV